MLCLCDLFYRRSSSGRKWCVCSVSYDSNSLCYVCVISSIEEAVQEGNGVCGVSYDSNSLCCVCVISSIEEAVQERNDVCVVFLTTPTVCVC